jgi:hypothetical protein
MHNTPRNLVIVLSILSIMLACLASCTVNPISYNSSLPDIRGELLEYASFDDQVAGIAVSRGGRIFVCFPRWDKNPAYSVAEVQVDGSLRPYPDKDWNRWGIKKDSRSDSHFIAVQSLFVDRNNVLWILDSPAPFLQGAQPIEAKLVGIDLGSDQIKKVVTLDKTVVPRNSFLRNVCVDQWESFAYISDAGTGALIVTDLDSGVSRRVLANDTSTKAGQVVLTIGGKELRNDQGKAVQLHVDGIALDQECANLYYHALSAHTLYRIQTRYLDDPILSGEELGKHVERLTDTGSADGIAMDSDDNLYLTAPEENAIKRYRVYDNSLVTLARDDHITWPGSISIAPNDFLYFTASQFNRLPCFNNGKDKRIPPYKVFRVRKMLMHGA